MSLMTSPAGFRGATLVSAEDFERHFRDAVTLLRSVRSTLADLLEQVADGGPGARELGARQADLEAALRRAFDAEARWNEFQGRQGGGARGEMDLDAVRDQIAGRIARSGGCGEEG